MITSKVSQTCYSSPGLSYEDRGSLVQMENMPWGATTFGERTKGVHVTSLSVDGALERWGHTLHGFSGEADVIPGG